MIRTEKLCKTLDGNVVLKDLNLSVKRGSIYGLIGSNGAGKSTLLNILSGIYKADSGEAEIYGKDIYENTKIKGKTAYITDTRFTSPGTPLTKLRGILTIFTKASAWKNTGLSLRFSLLIRLRK